MPRAVSLLFIACMRCCQKCDNKTLSLPLRGQWSSKIGQSRCITAITGFFSGALHGWPDTRASAAYAV